ncbi:hypothetical protein RND71_032202 [Anisodus tanguticus]|uniref:Uncharacterized protein n=1 Tax=Anisodus tanguticus TaxID=243964 RepID=A0AAE1UZL8_9SOLA|nr:hypothetical protein RND71_032202 [Anisodus tanguticus]
MENEYGQSEVTHFSSGGFVVGFQVNHTMMDAYSLNMFLNALSDLIQRSSTPSILPVWQRDLLSAKSSPFIICTHHLLDLINLILDGQSPFLEEFQKPTSFICIGVPVNNDKGEKGILLAISLPRVAMEKFQEVVYKMTFKNVEGVNIISKIFCKKLTLEVCFVKACEF